MLRRLVIVGLLLIGFLLVAPAAEPPVRVGYVTSDSMEPALQAGDAFIAVPSDDVRAGDVILFWSATRGEYVTHRVVDETASGLITKGDANPVTDQEAGLPPVHPTGVVGEAATVGGAMVRLPLVGTVVPIVRQYRAALVGGLLLVAAFIFVREERVDGTAQRPVIRVGDIAKPLFAVGIVTVVAATPLGAGAFQLTYVAVESGDATGQTVPVGERVQRSVSIPAQSSPLTHTVVRGEGMRVEEATRTGTTLNVSVSIPPPTVPGVERLTLNVFPYPAVLPPAVIERLHDIHPLAAVGTCVTVVFGPLYALYALLFDGRRPIVLPRSRFLRRLLGV